MTRAAILAVLPLVFAGSTAFAEATDEGAARLTQVFQTYLGTVEGVVTVAVAGDSYTLTLDAAPFAALAAENGGSASVSPMVMTLTDNGDGTWDVTQDQALTLAFAVPGQVDVKADIASFTSEGVFDEALMSFTSSTSEMTNLTMVQKITDPTAGEMTSNVTVASATYETTGVAGAAGGVDNTVKMELTGLTQDFLVPATEGMPAMPVTMTAETMVQTGKIDGLRPDAFYQMMAWFVANPSEEAMLAQRAGMKSILQAGLPLFGAMTTTSTGKNIAVTTPMGGVSMAEIGIDVDVNGLVAEGKLREAISVKGLTLPTEMIPPWAVPILPKDISFDFQVTDFDAAAAANVAMGLFDLPPGTEPDDAFNAALLAALLPKGTVTIGLNPGGISGDGYALTYQGAMVAGPETEIPTGTATITLTGIETLQAALDAAPEDIKGQAMMGVGMAQGMAKPGPNGELVWEIDASVPGSLSVNGMQMMGGN
jgi:hypothetical protein